jgi:CheY-like chemotaxis protein
MKILIIDDDELYRAIICKALRAEGYETFVSPDGQSAMNSYKDLKFDLVITDIFMPEKDGIEVIEEIKEVHPHMKVVAISGNAAAGHGTFLELAQTCGADAVLEKPFTPEQLLEKIQALAS